MENPSHQDDQVMAEEGYLTKSVVHHTHGLVPIGLPQPLEEWTLQNKIQEYSYIEKDSMVCLGF